MENEVILNGKKLTEEQFIEEKAKIKKLKGVLVVETSNNVYVTKIRG